MRSPGRTLSTAAVLITLSSLRSNAAPAVTDANAAAVRVAPQDAPRTVLVLRSAMPSRDGRTVCFQVYQQVAPLLAVHEDDGTQPPVMVRPADIVQCAFNVELAGWESLGTVTIEQLGDGGAAGNASASAPADAAGATEAGERLELTLAPMRPNPAHHDALVANVVLPTADAARLELLDVMGRRVAARELGSLGIGRHAVDLATGQRLAPGVYLLRLTQGASTRVTRVAVIE